MEKYNKSIKLFIKIFFIALAIYLIFWHPLFTLLTLIILFIIGYFLLSKSNEIIDFFNDLFDR